MNVAGISYTQEGPKFDFVFLCHQECTAEISHFGAINESPFKSQGQMLQSSCGWTSRVHPVPDPREQGCVRFRTGVILSALSLICEFILPNTTYVWIHVHAITKWWSLFQRQGTLLQISHNSVSAIKEQVSICGSLFISLSTGLSPGTS